MSAETSLLHAALHCDSEDHASQFFTKILDLKKIKEFTISADLAKQIFKIESSVKIILFGNQDYQLEVFITQDHITRSFTHLCIGVPDKQAFVDACSHYGLVPYEVIRGEKTLLFVYDFVGNLFEIKEI